MQNTIDFIFVTSHKKQGILMLRKKDCFLQENKKIKRKQWTNLDQRKTSSSKRHDKLFQMKISQNFFHFHWHLKQMKQSRWHASKYLRQNAPKLWICNHIVFTFSKFVCNVDLNENYQKTQQWNNNGLLSRGLWFRSAFS